MKFSIFIKCLLLFPLMIGCDSHEPDIFVINPLNFSEDKFTLSMIADEINYIPLDNQIPLGLYYTFLFNRHGLFISTKESGLLHFDNKGNFVKTLARKGRGPDEFQYGLRFTMDVDNKNIFLIDRNIIKAYHINGHFIRSFSTKDYFDAGPADIKFLNSSLFLVDYGEAGTFKYNWIITDTLGNKLSVKYNSYTNNPGFLFSGSSYNIGDKLFYYNWLNDTIFSIYPDFRVKPEYLFAKGDFRYPDDVELNQLLANKKMKSYFRPGTMFETNYFIFLKYAFHYSSLLLIDKKTKNTFQGHVENYGACIVNDIDGGLHFLTDSYHYSYFSDNHEYIITLIQPHDLISHAESETFKKSTPFYPEKKKDLERLANSLNENDNPVLMIVKLKD